MLFSWLVKKIQCALSRGRAGTTDHGGMWWGFRTSHEGRIKGDVSTQTPRQGTEALIRLDDTLDEPESSESVVAVFDDDAPGLPVVARLPEQKVKVRVTTESARWRLGHLEGDRLDMVVFDGARCVEESLPPWPIDLFHLNSSGAARLCSRRWNFSDTSSRARENEELLLSYRGEIRGVGSSLKASSKTQVEMGNLNQQSDVFSEQPAMASLSWAVEVANGDPISDGNSIVEEVSVGDTVVEEVSDEESSVVIDDDVTDEVSYSSFSTER